MRRKLLAASAVSGRVLSGHSSLQLQPMFREKEYWICLLIIVTEALSITWNVFFFFFLKSSPGGQSQSCQTGLCFSVSTSLTGPLRTDNLQQRGWSWTNRTLGPAEVGQRSHPNIWRCRADMRRCQVHMLVQGLPVPVWGWKLSTFVSGF